MKPLISFRTAIVGATLGAAVIVGGSLISLSPAMAVPISGVKPSIAGSAQNGPRPQGPFPKTAGISSGSSVAKGRPMVIPAPSKTSDWQLGMKR
jgi:hypothetical protein